MMKTLSLVIGLIITNPCISQSLNSKLQLAIDALQSDAQFKHAIISLYVIDRSGKVVFEKNAELGLAPASTQKIITSVSAYELLGKNYRFKTIISGDKVTNGVLKGALHIIGAGDPTIGSWRWPSTKQPIVFNEILQFLKQDRIKEISGGIFIDDSKFVYPHIPDGWIWQDIGNYYGAGAWALNWHENQYDLHLRSSERVGSAVSIVSTSPIMLKDKIKNYITAAKKGTGDNAYIYAAPYSEQLYTTGTIPAGENDFVISGSIPNPPLEFGKALITFLKANNFIINDRVATTHDRRITIPVSSPLKQYGALTSPPLDSMNFWFLKKSINLYGEALVKAVAITKNEPAGTSQGIDIIRNFWADKGVGKSSLKIIDGSGLSPANRITTHALTDILRYARTKDWFGSFYHGLPEINELKMKDGYIGGVRAFAGYSKSKSGEEYVFAFIVNNFDGSAGTVRTKMYKVLDLLK